MPSAFRVLRWSVCLWAAATGIRGAESPDAALADLRARAAQAPAETRSPLLLALAEKLEATDLAGALATAREARAAARTPRDQLLADARIVALLRVRGDYAEALELAREAIERAAALPDDVAHTALLLASARLHWALSDFPSALAGYEAALALAEKSGDRRDQARSYHGKAMVHRGTKDYRSAIREAEISLRIAVEVGDRALEADALNGLGVDYNYLGDPQRARPYHERALELRTALGDRRAIGDSLLNLGETARRSGDFATAFVQTERAIGVYEQLGAKRYIANGHLHYAIVLREAGRPADALARLRIGFAIAEPLGSAVVAGAYHEEFALVHAALGDWQAAYEAERRLAAANDTALGEKSRMQLAALTARYEAGRRQQQIALLEEERRRQQAELLVSESLLDEANAMRLALGAGLVASAALLGAVIVIQRVRLRAERHVLAEAQAARAAAEEADRIKTRFLGIASHDIRSPLGNILNLAGELRQDASDPALLAERCDLIGAEAQRVIGLVEDLLTTAALESGKLELRLVPMDLAETVRDAIVSLRWQAEAKRQLVDFSAGPPGTGRVLGDPARLHQVVSNLVGNAIKFSPAGSTISLHLARADGLMSLTVRDRGAGLAAEDIPKLFKPFERLATHPTAGETSHGLGLSIAQEIARRHGGHIRAESMPGEGSAFIVELPAAA